LTGINERVTGVTVKDRALGLRIAGTEK